MKRALSIILVFVMLLALTACGNNASQNPQNGSEGNQDATQNETTEAENAEFMPPENYATVLLVTINPQFRLYLDADGNVLAVEAVNKDAKKIAEQLSFETDHYTDAVKKIVTAANENDFIKSTTVIHVEITDTKGPSVDKDEVLNEITTIVNEIAPELKLQVKVKENKPSEGETTIPPQCSHVYEDATCTAPKTCKTCGATDGAANGHKWQDATCTAPKTCKTCGVTDGSANGHSWQDATCTAPKTCKTCGVTDGSANGHSWQDATCTAPKTCKTCGATDGSANGHSWQDATCTTPKTCKTCGATDGAANGHNFAEGRCTLCGDVDESYRALTSGLWMNYVLEDGQDLCYISISFDAEKIYCVVDSAFNIEILTEEQQEELREDQPARLIEYQGETYVKPMASLVIEAEYSVSDEIIAASTTDWGGGTLVLERISGDKLTVKESSGDAFSGLKSGIILTYE